MPTLTMEHEARQIPVEEYGQVVEENEGDVVAVEQRDGEQGEAIAREETRAAATNRWILEGRRWEVDRRRKDLIRQKIAEGATRAAAADYAWSIVLAEFPPPGIPAVPPTENPPVEVEPVEVIPAAAGSSGGLRGLAMIPADWPTLPPNASLLAEVSWVQANRLRCVQGDTVDLTRSLTPAPSHAALGWLETAVLFPAKFADVTVKATANQDDDQASTRRERVAVEEISGLLDVMADDVAN